MHGTYRLQLPLGALPESLWACSTSWCPALLKQEIDNLSIGTSEYTPFLPAGRRRLS